MEPAKKGGQTMCAFSLSACLPFLPPNFKELAGRQAGRQKPKGSHNHVRSNSNERRAPNPKPTEPMET
jgi:hypothetical protein